MTSSSSHDSPDDDADELRLAAPRPLVLPPLLTLLPPPPWLWLPAVDLAVEAYGPPSSK
jgi:hypothetical protein